jgi:DNA-binding HxlR family transcriptional regulator
MVRAHCPPDVFDPQCPSQRVLSLIANRWTALVICALSGGTLRYSELQRTIGGISQKMLTQTLRQLERERLVARTVHPVIPPKVEYALTPLGRSLTRPLHALCEWAEAHASDLGRGRAGSTNSALTASPEHVARGGHR